MRILVFTEGTLIMHHGAVGKTREEAVGQVKEGKDKSLGDWKAYVPIYNAAEKITLWKKQGAEILFLTFRTKISEVKAMKAVLENQGFPAGRLLFRLNNEGYADVANRVLPDTTVEDDCESIGGFKRNGVYSP